MKHILTITATSRRVLESIGGIFEDANDYDYDIERIDYEQRPDERLQPPTTETTKLAEFKHGDPIITAGKRRGRYIAPHLTHNHLCYAEINYGVEILGLEIISHDTP